MKKRILAGIAALAIACGVSVASFAGVADENIGLVAYADDSVEIAVDAGDLPLEFEGGTWVSQWTQSYDPALADIDLSEYVMRFVVETSAEPEGWETLLQIYGINGDNDNVVSFTAEAGVTEYVIDYNLGDIELNEWGGFGFNIQGGHLDIVVTSVSIVAADAEDDENEEPEGIEISSNYFGDDVFIDYIAENFDTDGDGYLSDEEIAAVTEIDLSGTDLEYITSLGYFYNLKKLDLSNTAIAWLYADNLGLEELNVTGCTELEILSCYSNELTSLDVSTNTALVTLDCGMNYLTEIDVSNNTALETLYCDSNELTSLDVSKNTKLTLLYCSYNKLTALDISKNTELYYLSCNDNEIKELDISANPNLLNAYTLDEEPYESDTVISYTYHGDGDGEGAGYLTVDKTTTILTEAKETETEQEEEKQEEEQKEETKNEDATKNPTTGSTTGLALAGLALAGAAVVATKKNK